jgi:hypothetical protein
MVPARIAMKSRICPASAKRIASYCTQAPAAGSSAEIGTMTSSDKISVHNSSLLRSAWPLKAR